MSSRPAPSAPAGDSYESSSADGHIVLDDNKDPLSSPDTHNASVSDVTVGSDNGGDGRTPVGAGAGGEWGEEVSSPPPMVAVMSSLNEAEELPDMVRGSAQRSVTLLQPLAFWLEYTGYSPNKSPLATVYAGLVYLMILAEAILLFALTVYPLKLTESTMSGIAILSLAPIVVFPAFWKYMRSGILEDEVATCKYINPDSGQAVRSQAIGHGFLAMAASLVFVIAWNVILYTAITDAAGDRAWTLYYIQIVASLWSIPALITPLSILSFVSNVHRIQCELFVARLRDGSSFSIPAAIKMHETIRVSVRASSKKFSHWLFPACIMMGISLTYQAYGYFRTQRDSDQYNGIYYMVAIALVLYAVLVFTTTVTEMAQGIRFSVAELYAINFAARAEITKFITYLANSDVAFRIFWIPMYPAYTSIIIVGFTLVIGGFVRQATI